MRDRYSDLVNSRSGKTVAGMLGLPRPAKLRRYVPGQPLLVGAAVVKGVAGAPLLPEIQRVLAATSAAEASVVATPDVATLDVANPRCRKPGCRGRAGQPVTSQLVAVRFRPSARRGRDRRQRGPCH